MLHALPYALSSYLSQRVRLASICRASYCLRVQIRSLGTQVALRNFANGGTHYAGAARGTQVAARNFANAGTNYTARSSNCATRVFNCTAQEIACLGISKH